MEHVCIIFGRSKVMRIMVMDGQGGGVGRSLLEALKERFPEAELIAV